MGAARSRVTVRSYRAVTDDVQRRIYRWERWRLPTPYGVRVRTLVYVAAMFVAVAVASSLPGVGRLLSLLPVPVRWVMLPVGVGAALAAWELDGRAAHHALRSLARFAARPRTLAGLRGAPSRGTRFVPLEGAELAPSGAEDVYRPGRITGPARVILRYPAKVAAASGPRARSGGQRARRAKRLRVEIPERRTAPFLTGIEIRVPAGKELELS